MSATETTMKKLLKELEKILKELKRRRHASDDALGAEKD